MGSLLINPGGPGGSGFDFGQGFTGSPGVYENYDIIGFDPRGVGRSTPIVCFTDDADRDEMIYGTYDDPYGSEGWKAELAERQKAWVDACAENTGELLAHIDTVSVAHDMDMIRAVLGDEKLNYLGYSFGTYIGTVYAELFPDKVGRMVLDGAVEPPFGTFDQLATQMAGFDSAFRAYMQCCLDSGDCPFDGPLDQALAEAHALTLSVDGQGLKSGDGRVLDSATVGTGIALTLYNEGNWSYISLMFQGLQQGDAEIAFLLADTLQRPRGRRIRRPLARRVLRRHLRRGRHRHRRRRPAPRASGSWTRRARTSAASSRSTTTSCSRRPARSGRTRGRDFPTEFDAAGAPPILVIGTTNDPATPYAQSVALADELESGVLITYNGEGHTVYGNGVACIDDTVDDYFVNDVVPSADPNC